MDRPPTVEDRAEIVVLDAEDGYRPTVIGTTRAWNWQQGSMLRWLPGQENTLMFNDRVDGQLTCRIINLTTGNEEVLPFPIYDVSSTGEHAVSIDFERLAVLRPGYGYAGGTETVERVPADDGLTLIDLSNRTVLNTLSIADIVRRSGGDPADGCYHWVNHPTYDPSGERVVFMHRNRKAVSPLLAAAGAKKSSRLRKIRKVAGYAYRRVAKRSYTGMFSRLISGSARGEDLRCHIDSGSVSHFAWKNPAELLVWAELAGEGVGYWLIQMRDGSAKRVIGLPKEDGHCSFSRDGERVLTDTYPNSQEGGRICLLNLTTSRNWSAGPFRSLPALTGSIRCDLHPRLKSDMAEICFDSTHEGTRQVYILRPESLV